MQTNRASCEAIFEFLWGPGGKAYMFAPRV